MSNQAKVTPKDFFLWAGAMVALYWSVGSLIALLFSYIDYAYPNALAYSDPYSSAMRFAIASLIVVAPTFLVLMRLIRKDIERNVEKFDLWVRRWALYFTLFIAGLSIVVDLIMLINTYLNGDVTVRFALKALVVFLIAAGFFMHFLADLKGYWQKFSDRASYVNYGAGLVVLAVIIGGFFIIGSPNAAREYRFDEQRVSDLNMIQYQITNYWQAKQKLPSTLTDLNDPLTGVNVPVDPADTTAYHYEATGTLSFTLCATFARESRDMTGGATYMRMPEGGIKGDVNWEHGAGEVCFDRTIDPSFYPPLTKGL